MTPETVRRLVVLARHTGAAPSPARLARMTAVVERDSHLRDLLLACGEPGDAWSAAVDALRAEDAGDVAIGLLDVVVELSTRRGASDITGADGVGTARGSAFLSPEADDRFGSEGVRRGA